MSKSTFKMIFFLVCFSLTFYFLLTATQDHSQVEFFGGYIDTWTFKIFGTWLIYFIIIFVINHTKDD